MVAPFDSSKPLAGVEPLGYLYGNFPQQQFQERSGNAILDDLRGMGLKVRDQDFFDARRNMMGLALHEQQIRGLRPETRVPLSWINEDHGWDIKTDFLYRIEVTGLDPNTGEEITQLRSRGMMKEHPVGDVEADLISLMVDEIDPYDIIITGALVYQVLARPGVLGR
ncbi:hypothetical protein LCGC14_1035740 [marine sediment metagenome]|uniref:Uncharacterized protein n=1 Tax=marine sediment metagenome TaxID=412755 RepID=A0A0F9MXX7_9ZZZZ